MTHPLDESCSGNGLGHSLTHSLTHGHFGGQRVTVSQPVLRTHPWSYPELLLYLPLSSCICGFTICLHICYQTWAQEMQAHHCSFTEPIFAKNNNKIAKNNMIRFHFCVFISKSLIDLKLKLTSGQIMLLSICVDTDAEKPMIQFPKAKLVAFDPQSILENPNSSI